MKAISVTFIIYVLLLGSSLCWSLPQQNNNNSDDKYNSTKSHETTTAVPRTEPVISTTVHTPILTATSAESSKQTKKETTTAHYEIATTKTYNIQLVKSTSEVLKNLIHTTTAVPVIASVTSNASHHFDILSFMGGSIFTFCLIAIGIVFWKAYKMQIERNYRTI